MKTIFKRWTALLTMLVLLGSLIYWPAPVEVKAYEFYGDYTDVAKIYDANSCPSMQGLAVGSQYLYTIKIKTDDSQAVIHMTDKDTGDVTQLYSADSGSYLFYGLSHANDMDVWGIDNVSNLFVTTTEKGTNGIIRYRRSGSTLTKVANYRLQCDGADICATAMAVKGYSDGKITFITKWGLDVYMGSVDASLSSATIQMTKICTLVKSQAYIKDTYNDLTDYVNQGFGYYDGTIFLPISGDDSNLNRSVILVFNIDDAIAANSYTGLVYPVEHLSFRVTSGAYSALFEIESCDICSADGKLYFNANRRKTDSDTNHDGVSVFDGYTYTKVQSEAKHFTIQYKANGGSGTMDDTRIPIGYSTPTRANAFTRNGFEFAGWTAHRTTQDLWYYTDGTTQGWYAEGAQPSGYYLYTYSSGQKVSATSSIDGDVVEFYAQWTPLDKTYTIKYNANGGIGTMEDTTVVYGYSTAIRTNTFTRPGYTFVGWTAHRTSQDQWYYTNGTTSAWYAEGSQPDGYYLETYNDGVSVAKTTAVDGDVVYFYAQWERNASGYDYQLVGYINGADHGCEGDASNPGDYKFVNGKLVATFTQDSYVFVKTSDNADWFMTQSYTTGTSATLYSTTTGANEKMLVPGNREITFTLTENADGTLGLSYSAVCNHSYTSKVTTAATCTKTGVRTYTCSICGNSYTETIAKTGHSYTAKVTAPTCTTTGYTTYTCSTCGYSYTGDEVAVTNHTYNSGVITKQPTCTVTGVQTFTCTKCGDSYQKSIYATGHTYESVVTAPTCTADGYTTYTCKSCGDSYTADATLALGHSYNSVVTKPTCTEPGYTTYTCTTCGYSYVGGATAAAGHAYSEGTCIDCGALDPDYVVTDTGFVLVTDLSKITDGSYVLVANVDGVYRALGTTLSNGKIPGVDVNVSGRMVTGTDLPIWKIATVDGGISLRTGDNYLSYASSTNYKFVTSPYTFTVTEGKTAFVFSSAANSRGIFYQISSGVFGSYAAGNVNSSSYVGNLMVFKYQVGTQGCAHTYTTTVQDATCTASGRKTHVCDLCGYTYNETIPAKGHSYTSVVTAPTCTSKGYTTYTCSCGYSYVGNQTNALGHNYKVVTVDATCTTNGSKTHTCSTCGDVVKEPIAAKGHNYNSVVTAPTCTEAGYTTYTCSACGNSYTDNAVAATGHSYKTVTVDATCTTNGSVTNTCSTCGDVVKETIAAYGHSYQQVVTKPTCTEAGYTTYICICGHSYVGNPTSALGHSYKSVVTAPTCTKAGYTTYTCSTCGNSYTDNTVAATGHSYVGGSCTSCGAKDPNYSEVVTPTLSLNYPTLAFEDEILYNVYYNVDDASSVSEMGLMTFAQRNANATVADAQDVIPGYVTNADGSFTAHSNGVPAKMLGDTQYFKVYAKLSDGSYAYSDIFGYNAVAYAKTILGSSSASSKAKSLVVAMLNYGAAAQVSFAYNTDSLMNAFLTEAQQALVQDYSDDMVAAVPSATDKAGSFVNNGGYSNVRPTVSFEGAFSINYYFTPKYTPDNGTITFHYWTLSDFNSTNVLAPYNSTGSVKMTSSTGSYTAAIEGIAAKAIDEPVYVAALYTYNGTTYYTPVIGYSLGNYCKTLVTNGNDFGAATAVYGFYAKAFFAN